MLKRPDQDWENVEDLIDKWMTRIGWGGLVAVALYFLGNYVWHLIKRNYTFGKPSHVPPSVMSLV